MITNVLNSVWSNIYILQIIIRISKVSKVFARELDFKCIKLSVRVRDMHKIGKNNCISISALGFKNKAKYRIYESKNSSKIHINLLLIVKGGKRHYVLIKDLKTFMYDHKLHRR